MKRVRFIVAAALAAASIGFGAAPASAAPCHDDDRGCPPCYTAKIDAIWQDLTGLGPLFVCPA